MGVGQGVGVSEWYTKERGTGIEMKTENRTYYDFENDYKKMYGEYIDIHYLKLSRQMGWDNANIIINENINKLYAKLREEIEAEKKQYDFHPIPTNENIPFK